MFRNPNNLKLTYTSRSIPGKASAKQFRGAIRKYYKGTFKAEPEVTLRLLNAAGEETDDAFAVT